MTLRMHQCWKIDVNFLQGMCIPARLQRRCMGTPCCMTQRVHRLAVHGILIKWSQRSHQSFWQIFAANICWIGWEKSCQNRNSWWLVFTECTDTPAPEEGISHWAAPWIKAGGGRLRGVNCSFQSTEKQRDHCTLAWLVLLKNLLSLYFKGFKTFPTWKD